MTAGYVINKYTHLFFGIARLVNLTRLNLIKKITNLSLIILKILIHILWLHSNKKYSWVLRFHWFSDNLLDGNPYLWWMWEYFVIELIKKSLIYLKCAKKIILFQSLQKQLKILMQLKKRNMKKKYNFTSIAIKKFGKKLFLNT